VCKEGEMLYKFPDYNLLERENIEDNIDSIYKKQEIEGFFKSFNVYMECNDIFYGINSVTYVIKLNPGTKLSKIKSYKQDLIMGFNAVDVEFEISINGTGYLGIIIIKERKRTLKYKKNDIIKSNKFRREMD
jgi:DNA segregation ATPase FtsK/SpoIIIE-like protein